MPPPRPVATTKPSLPAVEETPEPSAEAPVEIAATASRQPDIRLVVRERRAPPGATCASVHLRRIAARMVEVRRAASNTFAASRHDGLCGLEFAIVNTGAPAYVAAFTTVISGWFLDAGPAPDGLRGASPFEGETSWQVDLARRLDGPIEYRLVAVVSASPVRAAADRLRERAEPLASAHELEGGVTVHHVRHRVDP